MNNNFQFQENKISILMIILVIVGAGIAVGGYFAFFCEYCGPEKDSRIQGICENDPDCKFPDEVESATNVILTEIGKEKLKILKNMVSEPIIQNALKNSNQQDGEMSEDIRNQIYLQREKEWVRAQKNTPFMESIINNDVAEFLRNHHNVKSDKFNSVIFGEHILTNFYGANVAVSVKTDNYLQSQDDWWQIAFRDEKIESFARDCEFDSSAAIFSEDMVLKITDENGRLIGILNSATPCNVTGAYIEEQEEIILVPLDNITPVGNFKINYLKDLVNQPIIQNAVLESNRDFSSFNQDDLVELQEETDWPEPGEGESTTFQQSIIENNVADLLRKNIKIQTQEYDEIQFPELILTNSKGVTIASTELTFHYIHNEDEWWKVASQNDVLVRHCGLDTSIEMSSEDIVIKIYNNADEFIGILNAATPCNVVLKKPISFYGDSD